jgi:hypothetical protein
MSTAKDGIVMFELDQLDKKAQAHISPGTSFDIHVAQS